jgi:restriction system protein
VRHVGELTVRPVESQHPRRHCNLTPVGGRYLIQCKRFGPDTLVGSPAVREFYGALIADRRAAKGIFIATSGFSAQTRDFAANLSLDLIDGEQLAKLLPE